MDGTWKEEVDRTWKEEVDRMWKEEVDRMWEEEVDRMWNDASSVINTLTQTAQLTGGYETNHRQLISA